MAEAKEYKQRVEELESQKPRRSGLRERTEPEVEKVQDDLRQCENKLRKYVQHSERLENERKEVLEAVSSSGVEDIIGCSGVVDMVKSLCEKLSSLEEECDDLARSEKKAGEYLTELDALREKVSELETQVASYDECKERLERAQGKIARLVKEKEELEATAERAKGNVSELQSERRRQMQYLENENLQLGDELKKTKKQLAAAKAERDTLLQGGTGGAEETVELQGLGALLGSSSAKHAPMDSARSNRIPLGSSRKRLPESPVAERGCTEMGDKENLLNKKQRTMSSSAQSPFASAKKKKTANPFSSVKKAARRTKKMLTEDTPTKSYALGDSEPTADVTGECNQS